MASWPYLLPAGLGGSLLTCLLQASFLSNWLILAALFCRRMKKHNAALALSLAALWRLLLPLPLQSPLSLHRLWLGGQAQVVTIIRFADGQQATLAPADGQAGPLPGFLLPLWALGAAGTLFFLLLRSLPQRRQLRLCIPLPEDSPLAETAADYNRGRPIPLFSCEGIPAPMAVGVFRARILLPAGMAPCEALSLALAHEYAHIRYRHNLIKWLMLLCCCLHWFNPLCWRLRRVLCEQIELSCDRHALARLGENARAAYAHALLQFYARPAACGYASSFSGGAAEARIRQIMGWHPRRGAALAAGCAALLLVNLLGMLPSTALVGITISADAAETVSALSADVSEAAGEQTEGPYILRLVEEGSLLSSYRTYVAEETSAAEGTSLQQAAAEEAVGQVLLRGAAAGGDTAEAATSEDAAGSALLAGGGAQLQFPDPPRSYDGWDPDYGTFVIAEANDAHWADRPTRRWFFTITTDNAQNIREVLEGDAAGAAAPGTADSAS